MKKLFVYGLSIALVAGATSCGKSSKGKMANDWTISVWEQSSSYTDNDGDVTKTTVNATETTITIVDTDASGTSTTTNGTMNMNTYTIAKDGTWSSELQVTFVDAQTGFTVTQVSKMTASGTWDFLGGVGEFKKNERVVFNTLSSTDESSITVAITGGATTTDKDVTTETFADGENAQIFLIEESKGKELILKSEGANIYKNTDTPASGTVSTWSDSSTESLRMTMIQK